MKKWPKIIFSLLATLTMAIVLIVFFPRKEQSLEKPPIVSSTWGAFNDYKRLQMLFEGFGIESLIDIPSQDIQKLPLDRLNLKQYIGVVSSSDQARALQAQFGNKSKSFLSCEISIDRLPQVDLILCWDQFSTMTANEVRAALLQFKKSGAKFLLVRHYPELEKNHKNKERIFQPINWKLPPYNFPEPIIQIMGNGQYGPESLALWSIDSL